jgi:hypothetical protein
MPATGAASSSRSRGSIRQSKAADPAAIGAARADNKAHEVSMMRVDQLARYLFGKLWPDRQLCDMGSRAQFRIPNQVGAAAVS